MKRHPIQSTVGLLVCVSALLAGLTTNAGVNAYHVEVDTGTLVGNANGPFYLDFQFNHGDGPLSNDALINNVLFGAGGSLAPAPEVLSGSAAGNLKSAVTMTADAANPFNEVYQRFTPSGSLSFDFFVSSNGTTTTPDALVFSILDGSTSQIPTTDPLHVSLAELDITGDGKVVSQQFAGANDPNFGNYSALKVNVTAVPEASTTMAGLAVLAMLGAGFNRGRNQTANTAK